MWCCRCRPQSHRPPVPRQEAGGGGGIPCGQVIRCFIAVRIRRVIVIRFLVIRFLATRFLVTRFLVIRFLVTRFLVKSFGGEIPCGPVIRCFFIVVRIHDSELLFP